MRKGRVKLTVIVLAALFVLLAIAWFDGGRVEQRMIEQTVELPVPTADPAGASLAGGGAVQ